MARGKGSVVTNNFTGGHVTEFTALNFPENAVVETWDCVFDKKAIVRRRLGFDYEEDYAFTTIQRSQRAVREYIWKNVAGTDKTLVCLQVGANIHFWNQAENDSLSAGLEAFSVNLNLYKSSGSPAVINKECEFASGSGYLFIVHPYCDPIFVVYDSDTNTITVTEIEIKIRDFDGLEDGLNVDAAITVPSSHTSSAIAYLDSTNIEHHYNLLNQGWTDDIIQKNVEGYSYVGRTVGDTGRSNYDATNKIPANNEVWWLYKDGFDRFKPDLRDSVSRGNAPAPQGHYILSAFREDRSAASGVGSFDIVTSGYQRPSTVAFLAGRVFYAGVSSDTYSSKVYFSKIIENDKEFGQCHQVNDPTSEFSFDILSSDGGVINIFEIGKIVKLFPMENTLIVFATNGVWAISGSQGIGFSATDYTVRKVSEVGALTSTSFCSVSGIPFWWNDDGIYSVTVDAGTSQVKVTSITENKNKTFYKDIPDESKRFAKGYFDPLSRMVFYLYRSSNATNVTQSYEYNRILAFNTVTQSFFNQTISNHGGNTVNGVISVSGLATETNQENVTDSVGDTITSGGADVYVETTDTINISSVFKFVTSLSNGLGSYNFTFSEQKRTDYVDWWTSDEEGETYSSYFVSGYRVRGDGNKKSQANYINIYTENEEPSFYTFRATWDYSVSSSSLRWSNPQTISHLSDSRYSYVVRRLKIRGHGLSCQFRVESVAGKPFDIVGWTTLETVNSDI